MKPVLILLLATAVTGGALWRLAREDSFTVDESPHLAAGYSYLHHQTGRLNPEHPPLVKLLAAWPVRDIALPRDLLERRDLAPQDLQYEAGHQVLAGDYGRSRRIIRRSRLAPILLTLLLLWSVYGFGRWLGSPWAGLTAALFLAASPLVLAHGHYVTTDVGAALGCVLAAWAFLVLLRKPESRRALGVAALAFGAAQLMKFSALLLIPFLVVLAAGRGLWRTLSVIPLGYVLVVAPCYYWTNANYPRDLHLRDLATALDGRHAFLPEATMALAHWEPVRPLAQYSLGVTMASYRVREAAHYYFRGENRAQDTVWYFPLTYCWKEPFAAMAFAAGALLAAARPGPRPLILFVALYAAATLLSSLHIGARHLLPAYPFVFLCAAEGWLSQGRRGQAIAAALWLANAASTAGAYPHVLSYCNALGGGTLGCYRELTDSNYDWGQDLERLRVWSLDHPGRIALDYLGGDNAASALGGRVVGWWSARGNPRAEGARYFAVSVQQLQSLVQPARFARGAGDQYEWLLEWRGCRPPGCGGAGEPPPPDYRVGTSIFVYDLAR